MAQRNLIFFLTWCLSTVNGLSQQPFLKNYQIKEGLLSNYTYFVLQDSKGYIWIGSDVGVSRFDGHVFTNYNTAHGMTDNEVFSMYEDRQGRIWFATLNGKPCFIQDGTVFSEKNIPFLKQCDLKGLVFRILEKPNGDLIYASSNRMIAFNIDRLRFKVTEIQPGINDVWDNPNGSIGGVSGAGVYEFGVDEKTQTSTLPPIVAPIRTQRLGDTLLISSLEHLWFFNFKTNKLVGEIRPVGSSNEIINLKFEKDLLWVGTRKGIFAFEYPSFRLSRKFLTEYSVTSMLQDREGGFWFSTLEQGLFYIPAPDILHYTQADGLLYDRIVCFARDPAQRLWIGSEGSTFYIYDGQTIRTRQILRETVKNKTIFNIRHFPDGTTFVVGKMGTLLLRNGQEQYLYHRASDVNIDANGDYWTGLSGLFFIPRADIPHKVFPPELLSTPRGKELYSVRKARQVSELRVEKIEFDAARRIWLATSTGLYTFDSRSGAEHQVLPYVTHDILYDTATQNLWALTESNGLFVLHDGLVTDSIGIVNNQGSVICRDLCRDEAGNHWIGSAGGLFRVEGGPGHLHLTNYWGVFGLGSEKINAVEVVKDQIYIGKDDGFLQIPQHVLTQTAIPPTIHLLSVKIDNEALDLHAAAPLEIDYGQQPLSIAFEGLSYRELQNIQYRYRLAGFDNNWHTTSTRAVEYAALSPGQYTFEVYAVNGSGISGTLPATIRLHVLTPFWLKGWFWALVGTLMVAVITAYIRIRERTLQRKFETERKLMESSRQNTELQKKNTDLRMLALRQQMNPHFIFNALNTIKGYYGRDKIVEANAFISKFARLLRLNLDYTDALIPLDQEIELLKIYIHLSQTRYPEKIRFQLDTDPGLHPMELLIPSMLLQPFVENAVIHGIAPKPNPGTITLSIRKMDRVIQVIIRDDGIGRAASGKVNLRDPHKPLAAQITLERLQLLLPDFKDAAPLEIHDLSDPSGQAAGTEVVLYLPFQYTNEHDQRHHH